MDRAPDVVVVGAGTSTALELARAGFAVSVVDKAAGPGHGSTSASSAVVRLARLKETAGIDLDDGATRLLVHLWLKATRIRPTVD